MINFFLSSANSIVQESEDCDQDTGGEKRGSEAEKGQSGDQKKHERQLAQEDIGGR